MADYEADNSDELSISKGESLAHLNKDPGGWTRVKRDNTAETGWVPSTYIQQVKVIYFKATAFIWIKLNECKMFLLHIERHPHIHQVISYVHV